MNDYLLFNGTYHKSGEPLITADNRGLRYGDGLFETCRVLNGEISFGEWHFERLFSGLRLLAFQLPANFTPAYLAGQIKDLCKKNGYRNARVRINIIRGNGGLYDPQNHFPNCIIQAWEQPVNGFQLNENGLVTGVYKEAKKATDAFSNIKNNNFLPYSMAALHAKNSRWNDALVLNTAGRICDATIANVFIVKNQVLYTCPLQEGCIAGIMRRFLLQQLPLQGFTAEEKNITVEDLLLADEVFLTNAIKGIRWVSHCHDAVYSNNLTSLVFKNIVEKIASQT